MTTSRYEFALAKTQMQSAAAARRAEVVKGVDSARAGVGACMKAVARGRALATIALGIAAAIAGWSCDAQSTAQQATPRSDLNLSGAVVAHVVKPASKCTTANAPTGKMLNASIEQPPYEVALGIAGYHGAGQYVLSRESDAFVMLTDGTSGRARQWAHGSGTVTIERVGVGLSGLVDVILSGVSIPTPYGVVEVRGSWGCQQVREVGS